MKKVLIHFLFYFSIFETAEIPAPGINLQPINNEEIVKPGEFPFMVKIYGSTNNTSILACAGVLIRPDAVLTLDTCFTSFSNSVGIFHIEVGFGDASYNLARYDDPKKQIMKVKDYFIYRSATAYTSYPCIALLANSLTLTETVQVVALPKSDFDSASEFDTGIAIGWTHSGMSNKESQLKKRKLRISPNATCSSNFKMFNANKEFCTGKEGDDGPCDYVKGEPFLLANDDGTLTLYGMHTYGHMDNSSAFSCENIDGGTVYLRIGPFVPWIKRKLAEIPTPPNTITTSTTNTTASSHNVNGILTIIAEMAAKLKNDNNFPPSAPIQRLPISTDKGILFTSETSTETISAKERERAEALAQMSTTESEGTVVPTESDSGRYSADVVLSILIFSCFICLTNSIVLCVVVCRYFKIFSRITKKTQFFTSDSNPVNL